MTDKIDASLGWIPFHTQDFPEGNQSSDTQKNRRYTTSTLTHIDLFTGLAGFTLACQWNGIETEVFCENEKRCQAFLSRTYPGIPIVPDVREFNGTKWRGRFILTAGVPCQPASRAGKQRGKGDDRWLWGPALRVVSEARPDWCLFENPLGINDVGLDGILADLESLNYEVAPPLVIPACAVNSPQLRNRYWVVAKSNGNGHKGTERSQLQSISSWEYQSSCGSSQSHLADTEGTGHQERRMGRPGSHEGGHETSWASTSEVDESHLADSVGSGRGADSAGAWERGRAFDWWDNSEIWSNSIWLPCADGKVRRAPDDSFSLVDGLHRSVLAALGNSIVPAVAYEIIKAIKTAHEGAPHD